LRAIGPQESPFDEVLVAASPLELPFADKVYYNSHSSNMSVVFSSRQVAIFIRDKHYNYATLSPIGK
jgi:hypothetical protein